MSAKEELEREKAEETVQDLLSAARTILEQAQRIAEKHQFNFDFGPYSFKWDEKADDLDSFVEWMPSGTVFC